MGIKGNEEADKTAKQAIDIPGGPKFMNGKRSGKIIIANYITSKHVLKSRRVPTTVVSNMRLS